MSKAKKSDTDKAGPVYEFNKPLKEAPKKEDAGESTWEERLRLANAPYSPMSEKFRRLRSHLLYSKTPSRTLMVTSIMPGEGKGFVCANLGIALARDMEHHVLLLDCDLRRPTLAQLFGVSNESGMAEYLQNSAAPSPSMHKTGQPKLFLIPSGSTPENPSELISSTKTKAFINKLVEYNPDRIVLLDSPPSSFAAETLVLAQYVDGVVLVVRPGVAQREEVKKFVDTIGREKIRGIVYNAKPEDKVQSLWYRAKGYGYAYDGYGYY
ncbi:MAG: polysaccharide biosynthesis tyrosine autokinase [Thermodesulfobacteriota bacterium]|nr:polysaccharide biosynthesis tyrosine autokinase [Thermodesulfobacteriota bacterium]